MFQIMGKQFTVHAHWQHVCGIKIKKELEISKNYIKLNRVQMKNRKLMNFAIGIEEQKNSEEILMLVLSQDVPFNCNYHRHNLVNYLRDKLF